ncbi:hypothetical protein ABIE66_001811 [Peribacillus sp. B2I2]
MGAFFIGVRMMSRDEKNKPVKKPEKLTNLVGTNCRGLELLLFKVIFPNLILGYNSNK